MKEKYTTTEVLSGVSFRALPGSKCFPGSPVEFMSMRIGAEVAISTVMNVAL